MPTRKVADAPTPPCRHWGHAPPTMRVFAPGTYEHTCPKCGQVTVFTVRGVTWMDARDAMRSRYIRLVDRGGYQPSGDLPKGSCFW